jgi:hypothetical protein
MTGNMAEAIAVVLGGVHVKAMPQSRSWGVEWVRPDGRFLSIESGGAYLYASESAYRAFHDGQDYDVSPVIDGAEWDAWGSAEWARGLAGLIGGDGQHTGGGCMVVEWTRPDGKFVAIAPDAVLIYPNREAYDSGDEESAEVFDF